MRMRLWRKEIMIIAKREEIYVQFGELLPGDAFERTECYGNVVHLCMKTTECVHQTCPLSMNAVNLANGDIYHFDENDSVLQLSDIKIEYK